MLNSYVFSSLTLLVDNESLSLKIWNVQVEQLLPDHIRAVQESGHPVIWISDPMHGNTQTSTLPPFHKTRHMSNLISELLSSLKIHKSLNSRLGGVHLELTGDITEDGLSVTECLGGSMRLEEESLGLRFESHCDPRLNFEQSLGKHRTSLATLPG